MMVSSCLKYPSDHECIFTKSTLNKISFLDPQLITYENDKNETTHLIFGSTGDTNIWKLNLQHKKYIVSIFDQYPTIGINNLFQPWCHCTQFYIHPKTKEQHVL